MEMYSSQEVSWKIVLSTEEMAQFIDLMYNLYDRVHSAGYEKKMKFSKDNVEIIEALCTYFPQETAGEPQSTEVQSYEISNEQGSQARKKAK